MTEVQSPHLERLLGLTDKDLRHFIFHGLDPAAGFRNLLLQVFRCHRFTFRVWHAVASVQQAKLPRVAEK